MVARLVALEAALTDKIRAAHPVFVVLTAELALFSLADTLAAGKPFSLRAVLQAVAAGASAGALLGAVVSVAFALLQPAPRWPRRLVWLGVGAVVAAWLSDGLGVWVTLGGPYDRLARIGLVGSAASGLCVAALGWGLQPTPEHSAGAWGRVPRKIRWAVSGLALVLAAAFTWVDQRGFVVEYPPATAILRWGAILVVLVAAVELCRRLTPSTGCSRRAARAALGAVAVMFGVAAFGTGPEQASVLLGRGYSGVSLGVLRVATDWDRDGHSAWFGDCDCAAFNAKVGPTAREVPGNGRDDNCRGGDLPAPPAGPGPTLGVPEPAAPKTPAPMSVVYITVDTVGVQHLGAYGYRRETTKELDRWAQERAVTFEQAYTSGSSTTLVLGSNFRGVYPRRLQWSRVAKTRSGKFLPFENGEPPAALEGERVHRVYRLPATEPRAALPYWLGRRGVRTMAVSAVHFVAEDAHLVGRFDQQVALTEEGSKEPDDRGATEQALTWLAALEPGERYFLWVHYLGPHSPSTRAAGVKDFGKGLLNEYDHELATFDDRLAPLLRELSKRQDGGEALTVMVSADHGEEFRQHRFHGHSVAEGTAHIPLFVAMPGVAARRTSALASSVDIFPTVLALTGSEGPGGLDGRDLTPVVNGSIASWDRVVLMDGWVNDTNDGLPFNRVAAIGTERRMSWDLLNFAEDARALPSLGNNSHGSAQDSVLREALTNYLERAQVDPRSSD